MYSREKRMKAIELYIKYDKSTATVIRELGYPSRKLLPLWYKIYLNEQETGIMWDRYSRSPKYSAEQKDVAIKYYLEHGRSLVRTIRALGYPCRDTLWEWCKEMVPGDRKRRVSGVKYTKEQKLNGVIALGNRSGSAKAVAKEYGVSREILYSWKNDLLGKDGGKIVTKKKTACSPMTKTHFFPRLNY